MPKYYEYKVCGYYLYYTSHCVIEPLGVVGMIVMLSCLIPHFMYNKCPYCGKQLGRNEGDFCQFCGKSLKE